MSAARIGRPSTGGAQARIATPEIAAVRWAVIGPASRIPVGTPVTGSLSSRSPWIAGRPSAWFAVEPQHPLHAQAVGAVRRPGMNAGIAWANDPSGRGWTPILGGSSAAPASPRRVAPRARGARPAVASRRSRPRPTGSAAAAGRSCRESRPAGAAHVRYAVGVDVAQSLENLKLEQDAIVLYDRLSTIEKDPRRARGLPAHREQRAASRRHLGDPAARDGRHRAAGRPSAGPGAADHPDRPRVRDAGRLGPREGARGRRGGAVRHPGRQPGHRGDRRRRARARRDLAAARRRDRRQRPRARGAARRGGRPRDRGGPPGGRRRPAASPGRDRRRRALAPERPLRDAAGDHLRRLATASCRTCRW